MQEERVTIPKKLYEELVEVKLNAWEAEFHKERVNTLEEIIHEQQREAEDQELNINYLKRQIQDRDNEIDELRQDLNDKYNQLDQLQQLLQQERIYSLQNIISQKLSENDELFAENWLNKLRNLLGEIEVSY